MCFRFQVSSLILPFQGLLLLLHYLCIEMRGEKVDVNGYQIHYEKVGTGGNIVLLLPGGIGKRKSMT